jgi:hypothetical protein
MNKKPNSSSSKNTNESENTNTEKNESTKWKLFSNENRKMTVLRTITIKEQSPEIGAIQNLIKRKIDSFTINLTKVINGNESPN